MHFDAKCLTALRRGLIAMIVIITHPSLDRTLITLVTFDNLRCRGMDVA